MLMRTVLSAAAACLLSMSFVFAQERDRSGQNQYQSSQERSQKAFLGITVDATKDDAEYEGVVIQRLQSDSPAAQAGLKIGDILLRLDDTRLKEPRDLTNALSYYSPGDRVYFQVIRDGSRKTVAATLREQGSRTQTSSDDRGRSSSDMARRDYPGSHHPRPGTRFEDAQEYLNQHSSRTDARWLRDDQYEFRDDNRRSRARGTAPQAFLGIAVDPTADDAEYEGVVIRQVQSGTPASQAGLKKGDILLRLDDTRLKEQQDLNTAMSYYEAGDKVYFDLFRDGGRKTIAVTLRDRQNTRSQSGQLARQGGQSRQSGSNAFLGAAVEPAPDDSEYEGLVIQHIQSGGPAEQAGLQEDDILLRLDDMLLKERADLNEAISYYDPGEKVYFQVMRDGSRKTIAVTLSDRRDMGSQSGQMARERWQSRQSGSTAFLGAAVEPTPDDSEYEGLVIQRIQSGGPAEQAGLQQDDILLRLDDMRLKERADLNEAISYYDPGEKVYFQVMRDGSRKTIAVTLRARPAMRSQAEAARGDRATRLERAYRGADRDEQRQAQSTQEQAFLGVRLRELTDELKRELKSDVDQGAFVAEVIAGSPAAMAGLRAGDVITTIDGQDISEPRQAQQAIHNAGAGSEVTLEIARGNETRELTATLGEAQVDLIVIFPMPGLFGPGETEETGRAYHSPEPTTGSDSNEEIRRLNQKIDQMSQEIRDLRRRLSERP